MQFCCGYADRPRLDGAMGRRSSMFGQLAVAGGWLATHQAMRLNAGSQTYVSWLPVRTNSMVDPPKSITTCLTYHDSAMTLSLYVQLH
eukprot:scaffold13653_cov179-Skeletonema_marinoi.AAC.1